MAGTTTDQNTALVAELNDLLQLDHDAVGAYTLAIDALRNQAWRADLIRFRGDHERHIQDLSTLIRALGGEPVMMPHVPTGVFKTAVQAAGTAGGDREVLLAFKSNEGQVRDKYRRAVEGNHPPEVTTLLRRNADDEETHYAWVSRALERLGAGPDTPIGKAEAAFEQVHGRAADVMEGAERKLMQGAEMARRAVPGGGITLGMVLGAGLGLLVLRKLLK